MIKKKSTGIRLFGILGIIWGTFSLVKTIVLLANSLWTFPEVDLTLLGLFVGVPPVTPIFGIFFVVAGIGVLRLRAWGHELFIETGYAIMLLTVLTCLLFGLVPGISGTLIKIFIGGLIVWFFNRAKIRQDFALSDSYRKREKRFSLGCIVFVALMGLAYSWVVFWMRSQDRFLFSTPQEIYYEIKDEDRYLDDYTRRQLLSFDIYLPASFHVNRFRFLLSVLEH